MPDELKSSVSYGETLKGMIAYLYSEGVVSMERISDFICALSDGNLTLSNGTVCGICENFSKSCAKLLPEIARNLLNASEICTDATPVTNNGKLSHVRNFSTEDFVLYCWSHKKSLYTLKELPILSESARVLTHDHETALYHFGTEHSECNVHLERYLRKNSEETGNSWSRKMISFLEGLNSMRKRRKGCGETELSAERYEKYAARYDELIALRRHKQYENIRVPGAAVQLHHKAAEETPCGFCLS